MIQDNDLMWWLWALVGVAGAILAYGWHAVSTKADCLQLRGDVLLVFAHPDDEAMFFTPLLLLLKQCSIRVHFLALCNGNFDGLGTIREKELFASGRYFDAATVTVVNNPRLLDGPQEKWETSTVSSVVRQHLDQLGTVRTVITFDRSGVSLHPNHIDTFLGVKHLKQSLPRGISFLSLKSVGILKKYSGMLALLPFAARWKGNIRNNQGKFTVVIPPTMCFSSFQAMRRHESQMVWFRYLFVFFSSYSYVNEFSAVAGDH